MKKLLLEYWTAPRETMKYFSKKYAKKEQAVLLFFLSGALISALLELAEIGEESPETVFLSMLLSLVLSFAGWFLGSYIFSFSANKIFKVPTKAYDIRQSYALNSFVISVWFLAFFIPFWILIVALASTGYVIALMALMILFFITIAIWGMICNYMCLGEMMKTSAWKAFFITFVPSIVLFILIFIPVLIFIGFANFHHYYGKAYDAEREVAINSVSVQIRVAGAGGDNATERYIHTSDTISQIFLENDYSLPDGSKGTCYYLGMAKNIAKDPADNNFVVATWHDEYETVIAEGLDLESIDFTGLVKEDFACEGNMSAVHKKFKKGQKNTSYLRSNLEGNFVSPKK